MLLFTNHHPHIPSLHSNHQQSLRSVIDGLREHIRCAQEGEASCPHRCARAGDGRPPCCARAGEARPLRCARDGTGAKRLKYKG